MDAQADLSLAGHTDHFVGFVMRRLNYICNILNKRKLTTKSLMSDPFLSYDVASVSEIKQRIKNDNPLVD